MRRVITYGTFDLLHYGHVNLLRRARALGDSLTVALSTDAFNFLGKGKDCYYNYEHRRLMLEAIRYVDEVVPEWGWDRKLADAKFYDILVMGDDWAGKFDDLGFHEVVYLPRTPDISTSVIKEDISSGRWLDTKAVTGR
jgi:glycerol-3-phosphate cytidylyltransferase